MSYRILSLGNHNLKEHAGVLPNALLICPTQYKILPPPKYVFIFVCLPLFQITKGHGCCRLIMGRLNMRCILRNDIHPAMEICKEPIPQI